MNELFTGRGPAPVGSSARRMLPLDPLEHQAARFGGVAPTEDLDPFLGLEILVMGEEMLDLLDRDRRQIGMVVDVGVALGERRRGHGEQLLVAAVLVLHQENADDPAAHHRAGNDRAGVGDDHVAWVAVVR